MSDYSHLFTGFQKIKILKINPDEEEIEELTGEYPEDFKNYTWNKGDVLGARIDIYMQDIGDNIFKHTIYISDELVKYNSGSKQYINCVGDTQAANTEDDLWDSFRYFETGDWVNGKLTNKQILGEKKYHIARKGEAELLHFRKLLLNKNMTDVRANLFLDWDKLLTGDFSRLNKDIPDNGEYHMTVLLYVDEDLRQKVWREFLPVKMLSELQSQSFSKYTTGTWNKYKKNIESEFNGLRGHYYLGRFKQFTEDDFMIKKELSEELLEY
jgi:hypothetical protein